MEALSKLCHTHSALRCGLDHMILGTDIPHLKFKQDVSPVIMIVGTGIPNFKFTHDVSPVITQIIPRSPDVKKSNASFQLQLHSYALHCQQKAIDLILTKRH